MYAISIENEIRNTGGRIEYRWYHADITRFEAAWVSGVPPKRSRGKLRVYYNASLVGVYDCKADAVGHIRRLIEKCPTVCKADFVTYQEVFWWAIDGR